MTTTHDPPAQRRPRTRPTSPAIRQQAPLPVSLPGNPAGKDLATGRYEAVGRIDYHPTPNRLELYPVTCTIDVDDPDTASVPRLSALDVVDPEALYENVTPKLMELAAFHGGLELAVEVGVAVDV